VYLSRLSILILLVLYISGLSIADSEDDHAHSNSGIKDYALVKLPRGEDIVFSEVFDNDWQNRWIISEANGFTGKWRVGEGDPPYTVEQDQGLIVDTMARKHAISAPFFKVLDNTYKDLFIQYELRFQKEIDCGGAYIKLLTIKDPIDSFYNLELKLLNNDFPYTLMFGPDKCGVNNKVHFIVRHKNPISGKYEEKHLKNPPPCKTDTKTHLYTLHILKDNTFKILIDNEEVKSGNLLEDFDPPFNPPTEIDDPEDRKPADWVNESKIPDADAVKPDDWDETAPATIVDVNDVKSDTWLDDEPLEIPNPDASKPTDWDDELDGDWESPKIPNPICESSGCGPWEPRIIPNPAYKGIWKAPLIDNPDYIGEWAPRKITNPYYFVDEHPHNLDKMGALGIEIWTMKDGILFDNFIITYNQNVIEEFTSETWVKKNKDEGIIQAVEREKNKPSMLQQATDFLQTNLLWVGVGSVILFMLVLFICFSSKKYNKPPPTPTLLKKKAQ